MKRCELCPGTARMYCESDEASLCFECDARVHGANFLVARHKRTLLCRRCQAHTPWKAAGARLGPIISVCEICFAARSAVKDAGAARMMEEIEEEGEGESGAAQSQQPDADADVSADSDSHDDDHESEESEDEEYEDEEEEEEGEEQVVPWTMEETADLPPPPPVASSSSSEGESAAMRRSGNGMLKRVRGNVDLPSSFSYSQQQDQLPSSSASRTAQLKPGQTLADDEVTSDTLRPWKDRKRSGIILQGSHQLELDLMPFGSAHRPI